METIGGKIMSSDLMEECEKPSWEEIGRLTESLRRATDEIAAERTEWARQVERARIAETKCEVLKGIITRIKAILKQSDADRKLRDLIAKAFVPPDLCEADDADAIEAMLDASEADPFNEEQIQRMLRR